MRPVLIDPDHPVDSASTLSFASITALDLDRSPTSHYELARADPVGDSIR